MLRPRLLLALLCFGVAVSLIGSRILSDVRQSGPRDAAERFLAAFLDGDLQAAAALSTHPIDDPPRLNRLATVAASVDRVTFDGKNAATAFGRLASGRESIPIRLHLLRTEADDWRIDGVELLVADPDVAEPVSFERLEAIGGVEIESF